MRNLPEFRPGQRVHIRYKTPTPKTGVRGEVIRVEEGCVVIRSDKAGNEVRVPLENVGKVSAALPRDWSRSTHLIRYLGFAILVGVAFVIFVALAPVAVVSNYAFSADTDYESLISQALADDRTNNLITTGAPQQTVVNGWTARDLLTIVAKENADILRAQGAAVDATGRLQTQPFDQRVPALLLVGVLAICWHGLTAPRPQRATGPRSATA